jgi:ABC-type dipeptide/oligopeptide/nickel transport system permease component
VLQYLLRRLALMVPVVFLVSVAVFSLIHLTPVDPAELILGEERSPEAVTALRHELGLDRPLPEQYVTWVTRAVHGDLGRSIRTNQPVVQAIGERLPNTLELGAAALAWSLLLAIPLGTVAALRRGSAIDVLATSFTVAGVSVPNFFIGILLILVLSVDLRIFPPGGYTSLSESLMDNLHRLVLPAITLGTVTTAINMRFTRSSMLEVLRQDYIRTARAKGASWRQVIVNHALKNALIPVVTVVGIQVGSILEGALVTETIFSWPGIGKLAIDSIYGRDFPIIQGIVLTAAFGYMFANLAVDLAYAWLNPRISYA